MDYTDHHFVIGIAGRKRAGKDTIARHLRDQYGFTIKSFADPLRAQLAVLNPIVRCSDAARYADVIEVYGYEDAKDRFPEVRRLLQIMGTEVGQHFNGKEYWVNQLEIDGPTVIPDMRFPHELAFVQKHGYAWKVVRGDLPPVDDEHISEHALDDVPTHQYHSIIASGGKLDYALRIADTCVADIIKNYKEN